MGDDEANADAVPNAPELSWTLLRGSRDERGVERVVESSLVAYEKWRAGETQRETTSSRELDDLGPPPE